MAASMLARAGKQVLILEEGPYVDPTEFDLYSRQELEQKYRNGGVSLALGSPKVTYTEARCVGGGSEVNAGLFYRAPAEIFERWSRDYGVRDLSAETMAPHFEAIEKVLGVAELSDPPSGAGERLLEGAQHLGLHSLASRTSLRSRMSDSGEREMQRASMTRTLLPQAMAHGARVLPNLRVQRIRRRGGSSRRWLLRCRHAPFGEATREVTVEAERVYIACGAVQTPALLRRSGFKHNVGDALGMHATAKISARFPTEVTALDTGVPVEAIDEFAPRFFFTCASSSPAYLALEMIQHPAWFWEVEQSAANMAVYSARIAGGSGSVRTVPGYSDPVVRFRLTDDDLRVLSEATRTLARVLFAAGAEVLYPSLLMGEPLRSEADIDRIPMPLVRGRTNLMTIHVFSSCPMGENAERCAVDSFGRVPGTEGLYVADASLLCTAPTVNPQARSWQWSAATCSATCRVLSPARWGPLFSPCAGRVREGVAWLRQADEPPPTHPALLRSRAPPSKHAPGAMDRRRASRARRAGPRRHRSDRRAR